MSDRGSKVGAVLIACALLPVSVGPAEAQAPIREDPNLLRPPQVVSYTSSEIVKGVIRLYLNELLEALQRGDTGAISALVPDGAIPDSETTTARRAGCGGVSEIVTQLAILGVLRRAGSLPLGALRADDPVVVFPDTKGDWLAQGSANLLTGNAPSRRILVLITLDEQSNSQRMARVEGLTVGLCALLAGASRT